MDELLALFDREQRREINFPEARKDVLPRVVRFVRAAPGWSMVLYSNLDEGNADEEIAAQLAYFKDQRLSFSWKVFGHDRPADLGARLEAHGLKPDEPGSIMVLELRNAPPALLRPVMVDVRRIEDRAGLKDVIQVEEQVWGANFGWITERLGGHLEIPGFLSVYVAYAGDEPACAAWIYFEPGSHFAGLWGGSTVEKFRGQGLYTALLALRAQEAIQRGYRYLVIDAGSMSRPIVEKYGFQFLTSSQFYDWKFEEAV